MLVVVLLCLFVLHGEGLYAPTVITPSGRLKGRFVQSRNGRLARAFLGIPFAKPPLGDLRFEPPQPVEPWFRERLADTQPLPCAQIFDSTSVEDCLYLNVYTPYANARKHYPVMVYFHGGRFEMGSADGYTAEFFMDEDVVFVVVQYRLGLFGFLSTGDEVVPGNMGLKDQRLALRWIRDNIGSFSGDPARVTIYGQSVGGASVHYHMTFTAHECLFWAGISESGSSFQSRAFHPPEEVRKMVPVLANLSRCPEDSEGLVQCLRNKTKEDLANLYTKQYKSIMYDGMESLVSNALALIGGVIEPECVEDRFVTGNPWDYRTNTPWLAGVNSKEALNELQETINDRTEEKFTTLNQLFDRYYPKFLNYQNSIANGTSVPQQVREFYLDLEPISRSTLSQTVDALADPLYIYPTYEAFKRANKGHSYFYYLDYLGANTVIPLPADARVGTCHLDELFFFFPHPLKRNRISNAQDDELSRKLVKMWTNFATYLDPTPSKTAKFKWKPFFPRETFLRINQSGFFLEQSLLPQRMTLFKNQPFPYRDDNYQAPTCRSQ